jgi:uncharacterized membrane protein
MRKSVVHAQSRLLGVFRKRNVRDSERWFSLAAGVALLGLARKRWASRALAAVAGGMLLRRGFTGSCPVYRGLGLSSR